MGRGGWKSRKSTEGEKKNGRKAKKGIREGRREGGGRERREEGSRRDLRMVRKRKEMR